MSNHKVGDKVKILITTTSGMEEINWLTELKGTIGEISKTPLDNSWGTWDCTVRHFHKEKARLGDNYCYKFSQLAYFMIIE